MRLQDLTEARKPAPAAPVDLSAVLARLMAVAEKLAHHPFDFDWDFTYGNFLKDRVTKQIADHNKYSDDEDFQPLHEPDLWIEELPVVFDRLSMMTFAKVRKEIEIAENEYQARHGERMADEAGYRHDMQFVESSDWLTAMKVQARYGSLLDGYNLRSPHRIEVAVKMLEDFVAEWTPARAIDDEPILVEGMQHGLSGMVPLVLLALKKSI